MGSRQGELNARKHDIRFADAVAVLEDESALTVRDPFWEQEERCITLGKDAFGRLLIVIYTWRGERIRLSSARATARERQQYEERDET